MLPWKLRVSPVPVAILPQDLSNFVGTMCSEASREVYENWLSLGWLPMMPLGSSGKMFRKIILEACEHVHALYLGSWWNATVVRHNSGEQRVRLQFSNRTYSFPECVPEWRVSHLIDSSAGGQDDGCDQHRCVPNGADSLNEIVYTLYKDTG